MNIVMPMAGRGSRFAQLGIATPKPLIPVRGKPMYAWATEGLPLTLARRLIFICLAEHLVERELEHDIKTRYAAYDPTIIALDHVTEGQACYGPDRARMDRQRRPALDLQRRYLLPHESRTIARGNGAIRRRSA